LALFGAAQRPDVRRRSMRSLATALMLPGLLATWNTYASSSDEAYYLDPPSPPYCTPLYLKPDCFPFGRFRPPPNFSFSGDDSVISHSETSVDPIDISEFSRFIPNLDPKWWEFWKPGWIPPWR